MSFFTPFYGLILAATYVNFRSPKAAKKPPVAAPKLDSTAEFCKMKLFLRGMQGTDKASPVLIGETGLIATRLGVELPHLVPY